MDFELTDRQASLLSRLDEVVASAGGEDRAREVSARFGYDGPLDRDLAAGIDLSEAGLLERVLLAERLAEIGTATTFGTRAVLSYGLDLPPGAVTVVDVARRGPVRYAPSADLFVVLSDQEVAVADTRSLQAEAVPSTLGYQYGRLAAESLPGARTLTSRVPATTLHRLSLTADIVGSGAAAISKTASHLTSRKQFGAALASFQALRHRLADAAVSVEASRWLLREAAFLADARAADLAATYASQCAATLAPELVQMCGARGFAVEFGLHTFVMRLEGARLELGSDDRLVAATLRHPRPLVAATTSA